MTPSAEHVARDFVHVQLAGGPQPARAIFAAAKSAG
jgi:hypothetical protein